MQIITKEIAPQGSEEWLKLRLGVATASNFNKIITSTGKELATLPKYALELATQCLINEPEPTYKNEAMQRGNDLEPIARQAYAEQTFSVVEEIAMFKSDCGNYGASPDGLVGDDGLIEIKCPLATTHAKYLLDNKMPTDYWQQVQGLLWVSGRKWCDFVSFHNNFKEKQLFIIRVERDEAYIAELAKLAQKTITIRDEILKQIRE
jgi:putative phage-type endonuclease